MPDKSKDPKELLGVAAQQGTHAAKNVAAAATEAVSEVLPKETEGIALLVRVSNKTLIVAAVSVTAIATATVVTRVQKERAEKKVKEEREKKDERASWARERPPVVGPPVAGPPE